MNCPYCDYDEASNEIELDLHIQTRHPEHALDAVARTISKSQRTMMVAGIAAQLTQAMAESGKSEVEILNDFRWFYRELEEGLL